ncbi:hypothetical protein MMKA1_08280 [Methanococcus maripaludis KA1]|uniref:Probable ATP-binding protein BrxC winged helix-turn-helix domain-containing protein n=1 Tax=Methanococcus maripaludis KA1 TaxID=637914 RepID=A0A2Z5PHT6_METMI|nr:BREX system P-loop protein BrxC [Methanococcus maripaludis]BAP60945.1 hypothetical protein MMKA1_08280 [Methanococcus maripaludis KA1]
MIIKDLFEYEIDREIPEVIKLEDSENTRVLQELNEYVFTDALLKKYEEIFQKITKSTSESTQNVNVWISGYYGSGKSHFIKLLYHILKNEHINGISPTEILFNPKKVKSDKFDEYMPALKQISPLTIKFEIHSHYDPNTSENISRIIYSKFNEEIGYSKIPWIARFEKEMENQNLFENFKNIIYCEKNAKWEYFRDNLTLVDALLEDILSKHFDEYYGDTETIKNMLDSLKKIEVTPYMVTKEIMDYLSKNKTYNSVIFFIDELGAYLKTYKKDVGTFQSLVENFSKQGNGKIWTFVTSQDMLEGMVALRNDETFQKMADRFNLKIHLNSEEIEKVLKDRILLKNNASKEILDKYYLENSGLISRIRFKHSKRKFESPSIDDFSACYPFLNYQLKIIPELIDEIRGKKSNEILGGQERTLLKLAHEIFNKKDLNLKNRDLYELVTLDMLFYNFESMISSDTVRLLNNITENVDNGEFCSKVAKSIFLLQKLNYIPQTLENITVCNYGNLNYSLEETQNMVLNAIETLKDANYIVNLGEEYRVHSAVEFGLEEEILSENVNETEILRKIREITKNIFLENASPVKVGDNSFEIGFEIKDMTFSKNPSVMYSVVTAADYCLKCFEEIMNEKLIESRGKNNIVYLIAPENEQIFKNIEKILKIEKILDKKRNLGNLSYEELMSLELKENEIKDLESKVILDIKKGYLEGHYIYNGIKELFNDPTIRKGVEKITKNVIPEIYPKYDMLPEKISDSEIKKIFEGNNKTLSINGKYFINNKINTKNPAVFEIFNKIKLSERIMGKDLLKYFSSSPYGWSESSIRVLVTALFMEQTIYVSKNGLEFYLPDSVKSNFLNSNEFKKLEFIIKKSVNPETLKKSIENYERIFESSIEKEDFIACLKNNIEKLGSEVSELRSKLSSYRINPSELANLSDILWDISNKKSDIELLEKFNELFDEFEKLMVKFKILKYFLDKNFKKYEEIRAFTPEYLKNKGYFKNEYPELVRSEQIKIIEYINNPESWSKLEKEYDNVYEEYFKIYSELHEIKNQTYHNNIEKIMAMKEYAELNMDKKEMTLKTMYSEICDYIEDKKTHGCKNCRLTLKELELCIFGADAKLKEVQNKILELVKDENGSKIIRKEDPNAKKIRRKILYLNKEFDADQTIKSSEDIEEYLSKIRFKLQNFLKDNDEIYIR